MSEDTNSERERGEESKDGPVSRRQIVKAIGIVGGGGVSGQFVSGARASPGNLESVSRERISGNELRGLVRKVVNTKDVRNLIDSRLRKTILRGQLIELTEGDQSRGIITRDASRANQSSIVDDFAEDDIVVAAARHTLASGNEVTVVAYAAGVNQLILYYDFDKPMKGAATKARAFNIVGDGTPENTRLIARESSANGELSESPSGFIITSSCEGCEPGPGYGGSREVEECVETDLFCAFGCCADCSIATLCGPYGIYCGLACVATYCLVCMGRCCESYDTTCQAC